MEAKFNQMFKDLQKEGKSRKEAAQLVIKSIGQEMANMCSYAPERLRYRQMINRFVTLIGSPRMNNNGKWAPTTHQINYERNTR